MNAASRKEFFAWTYQWGIVDIYDAPFDIPAQNHTVDSGGRLNFRLSITPEQFYILNSAILNGLEIFDLPEYGNTLSAWIRDTNSVDQEPTQMAVPVGTVLPYAGNALQAVPERFLPCDGRVVAQADFPELFQAIGSVYGTAPAGSFLLPDMRGRFPLGAEDSGVLSRGGRGGTASVSLAVRDMPPHSHSINLVQSSGTGSIAIRQDRGTVITGVATTSVEGNGAPFSVRNPYVALDYIIRVLP